MNKPAERRRHPRQPTDLAVIIQSIDADGHRFNETSHLRDISGGGVCFRSAMPAKYAFGQRISLTILLDQGTTRNTYEIGKATVMWIGDDRESNSASIGAMLDDLSSIQRFLNRDMKAPE